MLRILISLGVAWLVYIIIRLIHHRRFYKDLPKPPHSFLWGHLKIFGEIVKLYPPNSHPQLFYTALVQRYNLPDIFYVDLWPVGPSQMFVVHPDIASQVENSRSYSIHSVVERHLRPMLGRDVIAAANGSTWKMLHRVISPAFAPSSVKSMIGTIVEETMRFHATLDCLAKTGEAFSMEDIVAKLIFDLLGKLVFGFSMNAQTTGSEILTDINDTIVYATQARNAWNPLVKIWAYLKKRQRMKRVDRYIRSKITERYDVLKREENLPNRKNASSVLDRFLIEKLEEKGDETPEKYRSGLDVSFLEIAANNLRGLIAGGHGTSTSTLCFIYILLSLHPQVLHRLREEHDTVFDPDPDVTLSILRQFPHKMNDLDYTTAVIKETLRMFPVGFGIRQANESGCFLEHSGESFPTKDQMIIVCSHPIHYNPEFYSSPEKFDPERFMDAKTVPRHAWKPFGAGPRACLGKDLAMDELRVILLLTVRSFDFECANLKPNAIPRASWTDLDLEIGDLAFQQLGLEARPRDKAMMRVFRAASR